MKWQKVMMTKVTSNDVYSDVGKPVNLDMSKHHTVINVNHSNTPENAESVKVIPVVQKFFSAYRRFDG